MKVAASLVLVPLVLAASCGRKADPGNAEPPSVHVATVTKGTVTAWVRLSGKVVPPRDRDATLSPRVEGVIAEVAVHLGERVSKGGTLARVDTAALTDALAAAEAAEKSAASDAEAKRSVATRTEKLLAHGVVSGEQTQTDEAAAVAAEAALDEAKAARATAARRRAWAALVAPFDGVVVEVLRHAGDSVDGTPATPVIHLAAEHPLELALDATAEALARLQEGQDAEIFIGTPEDKGIPARVIAVAASIDPKTGTGPVRLDPGTDEPSLILGRVVEARIAVARHESTIVVPAKALRGGESDTVEAVVVTDHKAHVRKVETGLRDGDRVEVTSGLAEGDVIVVDDPVGLADDAAVRDGP
jgi:RND family efflux transporter MFP subunit